MPSKLRSKIILQSEGSRSNVIEASHEGLIPAMIEQLEKNAASFHQEERASDSLIGQEGTTFIGNVNVTFDFPNVIEEF